MSRLPLPVCPPSTPLPAELVLLVEHLQDSPVSSAQIRSWTRRDPLLSRVLRYVREGWPREGDPELRPFWSRKLELSVQDGTILWGSRVVVPPPGRASVLQELHGGHPGISRMKSMARMFVWWPNMDRDIEDSVRGCTTCQQQQPAPPSAPLHPWKWPSRPWARIHMDLAGPFLRHLFLIVIDAHSKWIEAFPIPSASSSAVIQKLRSTFARFGLPETVVSDNGTCFTSVEFENFLRANGIVHITSAPYHPASNGLAERAVQVFKQGLKKTTEGTLLERISRFLFHYRMTPHSTTGSTPAELLMGRTLRTRLDLLRPNLETRIQVRQQQQKDYHDSRARPRTLIVGDAIFARNFGRGAQWLPGYIVQQTGPVSYKVELEGGAIWRRHQDHVRRRHSGDTGSQEAEDSTLVSTPGTDSNVSFPGEPTETQTSPPLAALPDTSAADPAEHAPGETSQSELTQSEGITPCAEPEDQLPIQDEEGLYGVVLIAPSVTPFTYINPSFRVFTMDASSFQLQEYQQYHLNLTKANDFAAQGLKPKFELSYTTSDVYGMKNLTPQSWATLAERFKDNNTVLSEYHYNVRGKSRVSDQTCDDLCKRETLCYVTNIVSSDFLECLV